MAGVHRRVQPMIRFGFWRLPRPWTVPRAHAFAVLTKADDLGALVSNTTAYDGQSVYWQTAHWLVCEGYATHVSPDPFTGYRSTRLFLTAKGEQLRDELGPHDQPKEATP